MKILSCALIILLLCSNIAPLNALQSGLYDGWPQWSPDGEWIAFHSNRSGHLDIWIVKPDGSNLINLTPDAVGIDINPKWSSDSKTISFLSDRTETFKVWTVDINGLNLRNMTVQIESRVESLYDWSPDGKFIAVASDSMDVVRTDIWLVNTETLEAKNLTANQSLSFTWPSWSWDGKTIAAVAVSVGTATFEGIYTIDIMSEEITQLTSDHPYINVFSSPTVDYLLATAQIAGNVDIWLVNATNGASINLTQGFSITNLMPAWASDSSKIAFSSRKDGQADIWVMNMNGENAINLTKTIDTRSVWPTWSPDGKKIAFETSFGSLSEENADILVVDLETLEITNITSQVTE